MQKKLRYDTDQASRQTDIDNSTRTKLLNRMWIVDKPNPTPEEIKVRSQMYKNLERDPVFRSELDRMLALIHYG